MKDCDKAPFNKFQNQFDTIVTRTNCKLLVSQISIQSTFNKFQNQFATIIMHYNKNKLKIIDLSNFYTMYFSINGNNLLYLQRLVYKTHHVF